MNHWGDLVSQIIKFLDPFVKMAGERRDEEAKRYKKIYAPLLIMVRDLSFESCGKITFLQNYFKVV